MSKTAKVHLNDQVKEYSVELLSTYDSNLINQQLNLGQEVYLNLTTEQFESIEPEVYDYLDCHFNIEKKCEIYKNMTFDELTELYLKNIY